jgi:hypothetical protein
LFRGVCHLVSSSTLKHSSSYYLNIMPLVQHTCSAPSPGKLALEVLAKLQDAKVTFGDASTPSMKTVTQHPIVGSITTTSVSWVGCARSLSNLIPSLTLWGTPQVESWVEAAELTLCPILANSEFDFKKKKIETCVCIVECPYQ